MAFHYISFSYSCGSDFLSFCQYGTYSFPHTRNRIVLVYQNAPLFSSERRWTTVNDENVDYVLLPNFILFTNTISPWYYMSCNLYLFTHINVTVKDNKLIVFIMFTNRSKGPCEGRGGNLRWLDMWLSFHLIPNVLNPLWYYNNCVGIIGLLKS